jgi:hypothetical protein
MEVSTEHDSTIEFFSSKGALSRLTARLMRETLEFSCFARIEPTGPPRRAACCSGTD